MTTHTESTPPETRAASGDQTATDHACLAVLADAILQARALAYHHRAIGMDPACVAELLQLMDVVHNIPAAIASADSPFGRNGFLHSGLRRGFEAYDAQWGPQSPKRCASGSLYFSRSSLAATYDAALLYSRRVAEDLAELERWKARNR